jgi:hypothetical protein
MIKYNHNTQKKIERIFEEGGYTVRYEKGSFNSGYCVLESKRVVVINRFHPLDAKINSLVEILSIVDLNLEEMKEETLKYYHELTQKEPINLFS